MKEEKKPKGRPSKRNADVEAKIIDGLSKGIPLTIICQPDDMPAPRTVNEWCERDPVFSADFARARETGFDAIAAEALSIADDRSNDTILTDNGHEIPNKEWMARARLRVDTRLKLLAKWDPKRYGDKTTQEITGPNGGPLQSTTLAITPHIEAEIMRIANRVDTIQAPAKLECSLQHNTL